MRAAIRRTGRSLRHAQMEPIEQRLLMAVFNVNSTADVLNPPTGTVTLRSAIEAANATAGDNTINLTIPGDYKMTLAGANEDANQSGDFDIIPNPSSPANSTLLIQNTSGGKVAVDGNHLDRVFDINPGDTNDPSTKLLVKMQGFTIENGIASNPIVPDGPGSTGGGIRDQGNADLTLTDMTVTNNLATADGGGVSMENTVDAPWTLTLDNTTVSDNRAGDAGGGVDTDGSGNVIIENGSTITGNTSVNQGGGVWLDAITLDSANLSLTNTLISDNTAENGPGGGVGNAGNGTVTFVGSTVKSNNSGGTIGGGGFGDQNNFGTLIISSSLFRDNSTSGNGGGIQTGSPITKITGSEIDSNSAAGSGGGIFDNGLQLAIQSSTLASNTAGAGGGGIELQTFGSAGAASSITDSTIANNSAPNNSGSNGGGIDAPAEFTGTIFFYNDTISGNFASSGGGIYWAGSSVSGMFLQNTVVAGNAAAGAPDADNLAGTFIDQGGNLIGVSGAGSGNTGFTAGTTQTGTVTNPLDPQLGPLQYNGGPSIGASADSLLLQTQSPLPGGPLIDHGVNTFEAGNTDERGFNRVVNNTIDIGAVEMQPPQVNEMLGSSLNPSVQGQTVTFTATVSGAAPGSNTPGGTVKFLDGSHTLDTEPLVNGVASFKTATLSVGKHTITAIYSGDVNFNSLTTSIVQTVNAPPPQPSGSVSIITDPCDSTKKALEIIGTNNPDTITVTKSGSSQGRAIVKINGVNKGTFSFSGSILVYGNDGKDNISIDSAITRSAYIWGGDSNDTINGGGGNDIIFGQSDDDSINGNGGRDILVGGDGTDKLNGGSGDDLLIAGDFKSTPTMAQLCSIQKEWTRTDKNYTYRVSHLTNGGGFNTIKLNSSTLFSSTTLKDSLTGGADSDLFFAAMSGDRITDKAPGETVVNIG